MQRLKQTARAEFCTSGLLTPSSYATFTSDAGNKPAGKTERSKMNTSSKRQPDLEKSLTELEKIVAELEEGDIPLEQALKQFEKGVKLSRDCQSALQAAEQRVKILMNGDLEAFEPGTPTEDEQQD
jgi:exodeoxyribonuclease VII small subunit